MQIGDQQPRATSDVRMTTSVTKSNLCTGALQGLETTVEESSGSMDRELTEAVARSNNSFREAAEGRRASVSPMDAMGAAATVKGAIRPASACKWPWICL